MIPHPRTLTHMIHDLQVEPAALPPHEAFPKIARLHREVVITEKIDGTNAAVYVGDDFQTVAAASRTKWITPADDNFGFARWVEEHREELLKGLGPGLHFGEWWGAGIGRKYGLKEKRFSLFNVHRWTDEVRPVCCGVVPVVHRFVPEAMPGPNTWSASGGLSLSAGVEYALDILRARGSLAAPGFMKPEGIVLFHTAAQQLFKVTLEGDAAPKGMAGA